MSIKHSKFYRLLSLLLVCTMLFELLPANVFAAEVEEVISPAVIPEVEPVETIETIEPINEEEENPDATVLGEVENLREENVKHFRMSDGSYLAVSYGGQIHYQDEDGAWQDIDNTLTLRSSEDAVTMSINHTESSPAVYEVVNGDQVRQFAASVQEDGYLFTAKSGENSVSMFADLGESILQPIESATIENADETEISSLSVPQSVAGEAAERISVTAEISNPVSTFALLSEEEKQELPISKQVEPERITSTVTYSDVWQDTDLIYQPNGLNVKESIMVCREQPSYEYTFRMNTEGLEAILESDGSILLTDQEGTLVFEIPAPYMEDADGAVSEDASYTLSEDESGYILTVTANADWMNDKIRAWPIMIDPTVIYRSNTSNPNILTSYVNSDRTSTASYQNKQFLRSGYYTNLSKEGDRNCTGFTVGLIYINNLPPVPADCVVTDSFLELTQVLYGGLDNLNYHKIYATTFEVPDTEKDPASDYLSSLTWGVYDSEILGKYAKTSDGTNTAALDYAKEEEKTDPGADKRMYYNITGAAQKWYNGDTSISRLLVLDDGHTNATNARVTYAGYGYGTTAYEPKMYVTYRDTTGISDIYSYHTQDIGRAGTGYVNDFSLNLTLSVPIASAPSEALPFELSLIYNSSLSNTQFTGSSTLIESEDYTIGQTGYGWKTSVQQTVCPCYINYGSSTKTHLVYVDADGTEHYFFPKDGTSTTTYEDEDGLGLTINTTSASLYTMTDKDGNKWEFTYGFLTQYTSSEGNILYYAYDEVDYSPNHNNWKPKNRTSPHRVSSVWRRNNDSSSYEVATLNYNSDNQLSSIKDFARRITKLSYSNGNLTTITFPDGKTATYNYTQKDGYRLLTSATDNELDYKMQYSYAEYSIRVLDIREHTKVGDDWEQGQGIRAWKQNATYSRFRYYRPNEDTSTSGKLVTQHYFDNWGRTINTVTLNADETEIFGATTGAYTQNEGTSKKNNRMTSAASGGIQSTNLLRNSGLESETNLQAWTRYGGASGSSAAREESATTNNVRPHSGKYLMKMYTYDTTIDNETRAQSVYLEKNKTYVFSAYVSTACADSIDASGGAYLAFRIEKNNKIEVLKTSRKVNYKTNIAMDGGWERIEVTYTPTTSGRHQVAAISSKVKQIVVFDDLQLEVLSNTLNVENQGAASDVNLLQMSSFERPDVDTGNQATSYVPEWWTYDTEKAVPSDKQKHLGDFSMTFASSVTEKRRASQTVNINATSNRAYILSGWGWTPPTNIGDGTDLEGDNSNERRFFGMIAKVTYKESGVDPDYHYVSFNDDIDGWQFASGVVVPKERDKTVKSITVSLATDYCANKTYMDDISLVAEPVQTYEYDDEGNLVSSTESEGKTESETDDKDRLTEYTALNGVKYTLTYEDDSRNPETITSDGVVTTYTYDAGNVTKTKVQKNGNSLYLESSATYNDTKDFTETVIDVNGTKVTYDYDVESGVLNSTTTPLATIRNIHNTANDRITSTFQTGIAALNYEYGDNGLLNRIKRKTFRSGAEVYQAYDFAYNEWGQTTEIKVKKATDGTTFSSGIRLAEYEYDDENRMSEMKYGNGDYITYEYDLLDRPIRKVYYNGDNTVQAEYLYVYSADGQLAKQYAVSGGNVVEEYSFEYDSLGRLIRSREDKGTSNVQRTEHLYDTANRLTKQAWTIGNDSFTEEYKYNAGDGSLKTFTVPTGNKQNITYDSLKRVSTVRTTNSGGAELFYTGYSYAPYTGITNRTTNRISAFSYRKPNGTLISGNSYTYDEIGNITRITNLSTNKPVASYEYDAQGQLTKETQYNASGTVEDDYSYIYDTAGNLLQINTGDNSFCIVDYDYDNPNWQDLLTGYDDHPIYYEGQKTASGTYSASAKPLSGNPITWYNGSSFTELTWEQGRRLTSLKKGTAQIRYTYDMDGIRTGKVANGTTRSYVTQNGRVVRESVSSNATSYTVDLIYDNAGQPFAMIYTTSGGTETIFYYVLNAQGDVLALINSDGVVCASYTYDAWGKTLTAQSFNANYPYLHSVNPLRYRGYYYDGETGFYYVSSRYYDPEIGRWINADGELSEVGGDILGYNLFAYCFNNPVNMDDPSGEWPKWLSGALNVVSGVAQMAAGAALGAFTSWTGIGAVAAGFLIVNGAATVAQGTGQIVNHVTKSNTLREDNIVRTGVREVGRTIGGDTGAKVAGGVYDIAVVAANLYAGKVSLEKSMPKIIESKVFSANNGYGIKLGKNIEMFYRNPNAAGGPGGTIFSYKGPLGKFRIDWDPAHGFHCHPPGH